MTWELEHAPLHVERDEDDDILYVTLGDPQPSLTENLSEHTYIRIHPDTLKFDGLEFHYASRQLNKSPRVLQILQTLVTVNDPTHGALPAPLAASVQPWSPSRARSAPSPATPEIS